MKKFGIVMLLFVTFAITSCATMTIVGSKQSRYGSTVELIENGALTKIEYKSYNQLLIELDGKAKNEMWSSEKFEQEKGRLPLGGYIIIYSFGSTSDSANTKYWSYIVQTSEGQEIVRQTGTGYPPEYISSHTALRSIDIVYLKEPINSPFKVYVIDMLGKRSGFAVYPNQ